MNIPCPDNAEIAHINNTIVCRCHDNHFKRFEDDKTICEPCDLVCPPGSGQSHDCNNIVSYNKSEEITCINCSLGYFSKQNKCARCRPECGINEIELTICGFNQDRVCNCRSGFYHNPSTFVCDRECSLCGINSTAADLVQNHECTDLPLSKV